MAHNSRSSRTDQTTTNPVTEARERLGLSKKAFCLATGETYDTVTRSEYGYAAKLPAGAVRALELLGVPADESRAHYLAWREGQRTL